MAFIGKESVTVTSLDSAESMSVVTDLTVDTNTLKVDSTSNRVGILNATPAVSLDIGSATDAIHIPVGTTGERPGAPASGLFRYNTTLNQFEGYTSTWGAIGGGGTNTFTHDSFTGDDTTTDFVLSQATESENNLFVFIDGVFQTQDAYSITTNSGVTTLTLSAAPVLNRKIIVYTVAAGVSGNNLNQNLFDANTTDAVDGINTAFTLSIPPVNKNNTQVFFDGVYQHKANYSISGSVLTFTDAPPLGVIVEVMIFTQTAVNVPVDNSVTSAKLSGDLVAPGNLTVTGYLAGPATFIIDPAGVGDNTGTLLVKGDLQVDGTQTIINSTTLTVDDLNITLASGAENALAADGAGITVDTGTDPDATITYDGVNDEWDFNKNVNVTGTVTADAVALNTTLKTWDASTDAVQLQSGSLWNYSTSQLNLGQNEYYNGGYKYLTTGAASTYNQASGGHFFKTAVSGSADAAITWVDVLANDASGNVGVGTSSPIAYGTGITTLSFKGKDASYPNRSGAIVFDSQSGSGGGAWILEDAGVLSFATGSGAGLAATERMRIDSSGTVKISHADTASEGLRVIQTTADRTSGGALALIYDDQGGTTQPTLVVQQNGTGDILQLFDGASQVVTVQDGGNLLVGQTASNGVGGTPSDVNGSELSKGYLNLNRDDIAHATQIQFGKNGAVAGRIHTDDRLSIGTGSTGIYFYNSGNSILPYDNSAATPASRDNAIDLGSSGARFKDLYLSEGISLSADDVGGGGTNTIGFKHTGNTAGYAAAIEASYSSDFRANLIFKINTSQSNTAPIEVGRFTNSGNLLVGLSSGQDALIHAQAPKTTYTDYATVFAGGLDSHNGEHAISLMTAGNGLAGILGSNLSIDGSSFSQSEVARSSGYISFTNSTLAGKTSTITFGGLTKGTATALPKMTLDGDGNLLVGKTAANFTVLGAELRNSGQINSASTLDFLNMYSTSASAYRFYVTNAGQINATSISIQAISDQRFKENIRDLDDGLSKVMQLKPRKFDWKEGKGADTKDARGFIAQEFQEVFPDLIGEWKDPAPEGEEPYKSVSQDLIPTLVKAIQEQQAIIEALTARIAALES